MTQVQAAAIGDRIRNIFQIGDFLSGLGGQIDFALLDDIAVAAREARSAVGTKARVLAWLKVAKLVAAATKGTAVDDQIVAMADQIMNSPLGDTLVAIVDRLVAARPAMAEGESYTLLVESLTLEEQAEFRVAGIDPMIVIAIVDMILKFWNSRRPA